MSLPRVRIKLHFGKLKTELMSVMAGASPAFLESSDKHLKAPRLLAMPAVVISSTRAISSHACLCSIGITQFHSQSRRGHPGYSQRRGVCRLRATHSKLLWL
jgi:hypothetical protein